MRKLILILLVGGLLVGCETTPSPTPEEQEEAEPGVTENESLSFTEPVTVVTGNALRGPWRMNESDFFYVDDPGVAISETGEVGVVWADNERQDAFFQRFDSQGEALFEEPVNLSQSPEIFSWLPRVAFDETGERVFAVVQDIVFSGGGHGGEIFFVRSLDGGQSFEEPQNLSNTPAGAGKGRLTEDHWSNGSMDLLVRDDEIWVAWTEYEGGLFLRRSTDGGESFEEAVRIGGDDEMPARGPSLAVGPDGVVVIAFAVGEDDEADIHLAISRDGGGSFEEPFVVHQTQGHSDAPALVIDSEGGMHLSFAEAEEGRFGRYVVLYAYSEEGREFTSPRVLSGEMEGEEGGVHYPSLALDGQDRLYLVWKHFPEQEEQRSQGLVLTISEDGGASFSQPMLIAESVDPELGMGGGLQGLFMDKLAVNSEGQLALVQSFFDEGRESRIRLIRGDEE